jgi:hypothetical protein
MSSWIELEKRFLEVEPALRFARLDVQTGTKGEYWRLAALTDNVGRFRFQSLSSNGVAVDFDKRSIRIGGIDHDVIYVLFAAS